MQQHVEDRAKQMKIEQATEKEPQQKYRPTVKLLIALNLV